MALSKGLRGQVELTVTDADTAQALGSGDVPVLGTPRALALAEAACVLATTGRLEVGLTTVGTRVELEHLAATPVGRTVVAEATLVEVVGRRLLFDVVVRDGTVPAVQGQVERVTVDRHQFLTRATGG